MNDETLEYLPFHALNSFMRSDYRQEVVRTALTALPALPESLRATIERQTRNFVRVPGFRNSAKAPLAVRIKPTAEAFEKNPELNAAIVAAWASTHPELRQQVYGLLSERGWEILPAEADRTRLPGYLPRWPKGEDFDILNAAFSDKYPEVKASSDDISLMIVWISNRLPYLPDEEEEQEESAN